MTYHDHYEQVMRAAAHLGRGRAFQEAEVLDHCPRLDRATLRAVLRQAVQEQRITKHLGFYVLRQSTP